ncbi:hypothetical protein [Moorena producens]|nr:hypothetical protein [Moorena producens]
MLYTNSTRIAISAFLTRLLPLASCLLPLASCFLPFAYCLFPIPYSHVRK